jgi:hypothetical protein
MNRKILGTKCIVEKGIITGGVYYTYRNKKLNISGYGSTKDEAWNMFLFIFDIIFNEKFKKH